MSYYENVFIARQDVSAGQVDAIVDAMSAIIDEGGGAVKKKEYWGLRGLAYRIKKNRKGHYVLLNIDAPSATMQEMERQMRLHEDVLRFLTVRVDALEEEPSIVMRQRASRGDRGGRHGRGGGDRGDRRDRGDRGDRSDRDAKPAAPQDTAVTGDKTGGDKAGGDKAGGDKAGGEAKPAATSQGDAS